METSSRQQRRHHNRRVYRRRRTVVAVVVLVVLALLGWGITTAVSSLTESNDAPQAEESGPEDTEPVPQDSAAPGEGSAAAESPASPNAENGDGTTTDHGPPSPEDSGSAPQDSEEPEPQQASEASWDPDSIHVLANRQNPLDPVDYEPEDLVYPDVPFSGPEEAMQVRQEAAAALEDLFAAAESEDMQLGLVSAYRSFHYQVQIYSARWNEVGTEATDLYMSRPGYSEHQTGLAADVISIANPDCMLGECFADTPEGQWVADHAHEHGFVVRYLEDMEHITGYPYEPWHLRYVGEDTAEEVYEQDLTLEEYWDQEPAPDYDQAEPDTTDWW